MKLNCRTGVASCAILGILAASMLVACWLAPQWSAAVGLDLWRLPSLKKEQEKWDRQNRMLDEELKESAHRIELKETIIDQLLRGRLSFKEAVALFLSLNQQKPAVLDTVRDAYLGEDDEVSTARSVIDCALYQRNRGWLRRLAVAARLHGEFQKAYARPPNIR